MNLVRARGHDSMVTALREVMRYVLLCGTGAAGEAGSRMMTWPPQGSAIRTSGRCCWTRSSRWSRPASTTSTGPSSLYRTW